MTHIHMANHCCLQHLLQKIRDHPLSVDDLWKKSAATCLQVPQGWYPKVSGALYCSSYIDCFSSTWSSTSSSPVIIGEQWPLTHSVLVWKRLQLIAAAWYSNQWYVFKESLVSLQELGLCAIICCSALHDQWRVPRACELACHAILVYTHLHPIW